VSSNSELTIVLPVYNEAEGIEDTVKEIYDEIVLATPGTILKVCEDGSTDGTKDILVSLRSKLPRLAVSLCAERKGYVRAAKEALMSVDLSSHYVLILDSDGQYDPRDFHRLWHVMRRQKADIVQALRRNRAEPFYRVLLSRGLREIGRLMFGLQCHDLTSGFRLMTSRAARTIASQVRYSKSSFWLEFGPRAEAHGYRIIEVPTAYRKRKGSSKVYSPLKMPKIVLEEGWALVRTWIELHTTAR